MRDIIRAFDRRATKGYLWLLKEAVLELSLSRARHVFSMSQCPIFIGGCARSGSTLLASLLSAHPNLYVVPQETYSFSPRPPYPPKKDTGEPFSIQSFYARLLTTDHSLEKYGRWCEKTPGNIHFAGRILDYFGKSARFIHIVRDGRDVVTSRHPKAPDRYWVAPERWVRDVKAGRRIEHHPQVLTVRYEDVTKDYMGVLNRICQFIDEPFACEKFDAYPDTASTLQFDGWKNNSPKDVHIRSEKRWKYEEHKNVVRELLSISEGVNLLDHYGYISS